jgi:hypothetical protein
MDEADESNPQLTTESEITELLGLFDAPAFARRGADLEYAVGRLHTRCRCQRGQLIEMVQLRLRQWASVATSNDDVRGTFTAPVAPLWALCDAPPPAWAFAPAPQRRRRAVARDLVSSVTRFNRRWTAFLDELNLAPLNGMIEQYNRFYVIEKECVLGSSRLALRHFTPWQHLTRVDLAEEYPLLPVPELTV